MVKCGLSLNRSFVAGCLACIVYRCLFYLNSLHRFKLFFALVRCLSSQLLMWSSHYTTENALGFIRLSFLIVYGSWGDRLEL